MAVSFHVNLDKCLIILCIYRRHLLKHASAVKFSTHQCRLRAEAALTTPTADGAPKVFLLLLILLLNCPHKGG